jgi:hypothetical protein
LADLDFLPIERCEIFALSNSGESGSVGMRLAVDRRWEGLAMKAY